MNLVRRIEYPRDRVVDEQHGAREQPPRREWLVTNGLGGYASGTVAGVMTRRYHGLLIAALPAPRGRFMMLNHVLERVKLPHGRILWLGDEDEVAGSNTTDRTDYLAEFRLELGLPVWVYRVEGFAIEKRILMLHGQNTVHVQYRLIDGHGPVRVVLRPSVQFRPHDAPVTQSPGKPYSITACEGRYEVHASEELPILRLKLHGARAALTLDEKGAPAVPYKMEESRGYEWVGSLWSPGYFRADLTADKPVTLVASTEDWETSNALEPAAAVAAENERRRRLIEIAGVGDDRLGGELVLAADQFIIRPAGRIDEFARASAAGDEVRTVIAGYHWFTDWGRDTMISLPGLTLATRRFREAGYILRTFGHYVRDGLIPNLFPEGDSEGLYHTADATLWFFNAIEQYTQVTGESDTLRALLPTFIDIVDHHLRGTRFGIHVDSGDGLLVEGAPGYQLTWMDAKVGDWVVTPRRGKAVEINALWYNALCLLDTWMKRFGSGAAIDAAAHARRARESFNARFWYADGGYLYDVVDGEHGDDTSFRPNQIFAVSLPHAVLDEQRWGTIVDAVRDRLLTPVGLRSLAPGSPDYKPRYYGDLRSRDAAYHQGTVWAWLIGPFVDAWRKVRPGDTTQVRKLLAGFDEHLSEACVGSLSEIFDADAPYVPRGCVAQAWSVAEVLRCWRATASA